jgi:predicted nucleic acid-binding protein
VIVTFDTNILVYAADRRDLHKQARAIDLLRQPEEKVLLWQVACEFIAASRKLAPQGLTVEEVWDQLSYYLAAFQLLLPVPAVLERARIIQAHEGRSFWDAMIVAACLEGGVSRLYSEDFPGKADDGRLEIINPFA